MARRNRQTLKKSFSKGQRPTEQDFANLIDSTLNILDDGLSKTPDTGIELAPLIGEKRVVLSVFREAGDPLPAWELVIGTTGEFKITGCQGTTTTPLITLLPDGTIKSGYPGKPLVLSGDIHIPGRQGTFASGTVPTNGKWQDITSSLTGVRALEIVVACGRKNTGKHAILVAWATNCFGEHARIKNRIPLWHFRPPIIVTLEKSKLGGRLQVKTMFCYGEEFLIHYRIGSLWNNPSMEWE
ncbi:MAG: hypothetical protein LUD02_04265 [Tannerellaceae bacterium]|nr:hypothetical protein [Tannerellaceae bacterium]MCD8263461.1 hypothetical protein [Tannerellaceae bacterium]